MSQRAGLSATLDSPRIPAKNGQTHMPPPINKMMTIRTSIGDAVNTAARVAQASRWRDATRSWPRRVRSPASRTRRDCAFALGTARVLGKSAPIEVVDVLWQEDLANVTTVQRVMQESADAPAAVLILRFKSQVFEVDEGTPFSIGRDPTSSLIVETEWVSRNHALIEWKRGYFMLADRSTNGTWLRIGEDEELIVAAATNRICAATDRSALVRRTMRMTSTCSISSAATCERRCDCTLIASAPATGEPQCANALV